MNDFYEINGMKTKRIDREMKKKARLQLRKSFKKK